MLLSKKYSDKYKSNSFYVELTSVANSLQFKTFNASNNTISFNFASYVSWQHCILNSDEGGVCDLHDPSWLSSVCCRSRRPWKWSDEWWQFQRGGLWLPPWHPDWSGVFWSSQCHVISSSFWRWGPKGQRQSTYLKFFWNNWQHWLSSGREKIFFFMYFPWSTVWDIFYLGSFIIGRNVNITHAYVFEPKSIFTWNFWLSKSIEMKQSNCVTCIRLDFTN